MPYWTLSTVMGAQLFLGSQVGVCPEHLADTMGQLPTQFLSCGRLHRCFHCKVNSVIYLNIKDALGWAEYSNSKQKRSETEHTHLWSGMTTSRWVSSFGFFWLFAEHQTLLKDSTKPCLCNIWKFVTGVRSVQMWPRVTWSHLYRLRMVPASFYRCILFPLQTCYVNEVHWGKELSPDQGNWGDCLNKHTLCTFKIQIKSCTWKPSLKRSVWTWCFSLTKKSISQHNSPL